MVLNREGSTGTRMRVVPVPQAKKIEEERRNGSEFYDNVVTMNASSNASGVREHWKTIDLDWNLI